MGSRASRVSKEEAKRKEEVKQQALRQTRRQLAELLVSNGGGGSGDSVVSVTTGVVSTVASTVAEARQEIVMIALEQLDRDDKPLQKADLIAIVLALKPEYVHSMDRISKQFTVKELNALIRTIVYDPDRIQQHSQAQHAKHALASDVDALPQPPDHNRMDFIVPVDL